MFVQYWIKLGVNCKLNTLFTFLEVSGTFVCNGFIFSLSTCTSGSVLKFNSVFRFCSVTDSSFFSSDRIFNCCSATIVFKLFNSFRMFLSVSSSTITACQKANIREKTKNVLILPVNPPMLTLWIFALQQSDRPN